MNTDDGETFCSCDESESTSDEGSIHAQARSHSVSFKKRRLSSTARITKQNDDLSTKYQHIRQSIRKVRPEFCETVDKLKSCYHMSEAQATAAVITVGNSMFGRNWRVHDEPYVIDIYTLPDFKSVRVAGKSIEVLALDEIVK